MNTLQINRAYTLARVAGHDWARLAGPAPTTEADCMARNLLAYGPELKNLDDGLFYVAIDGSIGFCASHEPVAWSVSRNGFTEIWVHKACGPSLLEVDLGLDGGARWSKNQDSKDLEIRHVYQIGYALRALGLRHVYLQILRSFPAEQLAEEVKYLKKLRHDLAVSNAGPNNTITSILCDTYEALGSSDSEAERLAGS